MTDPDTQDAADPLTAQIEAAEQAGNHDLAMRLKVAQLQALALQNQPTFKLQ